MDYEKILKSALQSQATPFEVASWIEEQFPELTESDDERMLRVLREGFNILDKDDEWYSGITNGQILVWLEKKGEQKPDMIQWKGDNLKEVIDFTGKDKNFDKWFKSFAEYERYVHEHNNIFKLFNEDGSHYEVPVGAWIVKTPDGYNVASKAIFKNKPAEWSEEDEKVCTMIIEKLDSSINVTNEQYATAENWLEDLKDRMK